MRAQIPPGRCESSMLEGASDCNLEPNYNLFTSSLQTFHGLLQRIRSVNIFYTCSVISELLLLVNNLNADATSNGNALKFESV